MEQLPAVIEPTSIAPLTLFGTADPDAIIDSATGKAKALARVIESQKLYTTISGKKHVRVEGWTLLGTMLGVFPVCAWTRPVEDGWEARVEARTLAGAVVGASEAQCTRAESRWRDRDDFALRSMAQTRATAKALRLPLGFVITLAGFDATPAEEMDGIHDDTRRRGNAAAEAGRQREAHPPSGQRRLTPQEQLAGLGDNGQVGATFKRELLEVRDLPFEALVAVAPGQTAGKASPEKWLKANPTKSLRDLLDECERRFRAHGVPDQAPAPSVGPATVPAEDAAPSSCEAQGKTHNPAYDADGALMCLDCGAELSDDDVPFGRELVRD